MAQKKIIWSGRASRDLISILDFYIQRNGTTTFSEKLLAEIDTVVSFLPDHPLLGKNTEKESLRVLIRGTYEIFYRVDPDAIIVVAIWDSRRDPEQKPIR
jgi:plasmid stabilization system protein ParE